MYIIGNYGKVINKILSATKTYITLKQKYIEEMELNMTSRKQRTNVNLPAVNAELSMYF